MYKLRDARDVWKYFSAAAIIDESVLKYDRVKKGAKKKAYIRLSTSHGQLNLELHCDLAPKTCENFIKACSRTLTTNNI